MEYAGLDGKLMSFAGVTKDFKEEWQWTRYMVGGKMFLAVCKDDAGRDSLITLKLAPENGRRAREMFPDIIPGYYMNKEHWNSIRIGGDVPEEVVEAMAEEAYSLVLASLPKKMREQIALEAK